MHRSAFLASLLFLSAGLPALAEMPDDLVFRAIPSCRALDTRETGGMLRPGAPRTVEFSVACGLPWGTTAAVLANVIAVTPTGNGWMSAWPSDRSLPNTSIINFSSTAGSNFANAVVLEMCSPSRSDCAWGEVTFQSFLSSVHLVIDVLGYFIKPSIPGAFPSSALECANGEIQYGLSYHVVEWHQAALACPPGTWVCSRSERGTAPCDGNRPDGTCDFLDCTGVCRDAASSAHPGWTTGGSSPVNGFLTVETGAQGSSATCSHYPAWCCWR